MNVPTPLCQKPWPYHFSMQVNLSFRPATPRAWPSPSYPHAVHHQLTYEDDTMENHSSEDDILAHYLPSIEEEEDDDMEEHFPTVSLDDDFWDERSNSGEALVHSWRCTTWFVPLSMPAWFKPATPCPGRCTVHGSQWHLWFPRYHGICWWWYTQPGRLFKLWRRWRR